MTANSFDQTRGNSPSVIKQGTAAPLSQNEVTSLCIKAARGAGMSWGLAEEAGYAAAWLVRHGIDGPKHLYSHLHRAQGRPWSDLCPTVAPGVWQAPADGALCPIALGATLCDFAALSEGIAVGSSLEIGTVDHPLLLIPFLAAITETTGLQFDVEWSNSIVSLNGGSDRLMHAEAALDGQQMPIKLTARFGKPPPPTAGGVPKISAEIIAALNTLAMRTTVPSSEASRLGAGSTTTDND